MLLSERTVVIVDPDADSSERLSRHLRAEGARCFHAPDAVTAAWGARETLPEIIITELELPDIDAGALLVDLRGAPECASVPAIALTANRSLLARTQASVANFEKFLTKPVRLSDVTDAICSLLGSRTLPDPEPFPSLDELGGSLERHDYRALLRTLNGYEGYRYTSFLRRDEAELHSVWTYDRERPALDPFPLHVPHVDTPCGRVLAERESVGYVDTTTDDRLARSSRQLHMRSFVGVPVFDDGGGNWPIGTLCHFDSEPRRVDAATLGLLERVARLFEFVNRRKRVKRT